MLVIVSLYAVSEKHVKRTAVNHVVLELCHYWQNCCTIVEIRNPHVVREIAEDIDDTSGKGKTWSWPAHRALMSGNNRLRVWTFSWIDSGVGWYETDSSFWESPPVTPEVRLNSLPSILASEF